jgi:hypothetical protein
MGFCPPRSSLQQKGSDRINRIDETREGREREGDRADPNSSFKRALPPAPFFPFFSVNPVNPVY